MSPPKTVYIVDDDRDARISLQALLRSAGITGWPFGSAADFLDSLPHLRPGCLLVDLRMPAMDGILLIEKLGQLGVQWPAVLLTGQADVPSAIAALRLGVIDLLEKPYDDTQLLQVLDRCFEKIEERVAIAEEGGRVALLSRRERETLEGLVCGESSKAIAHRLKLSPRTVEMHRARMMKKLAARTTAEALAAAAAAGYRLRRPSGGD